MIKGLLNILFLFATCYVQSQNINQFLPNVFSEMPNVRDLAMNKDKTEAYFTVESYKKGYSFIAYITKENGIWSSPKTASFSGKYKDLEPFLSPDELTLFFASNRKNNTSNEIKKDIDIWFVTRKSIKGKWSKPKNIGSTINTNKNEFFPSVTAKGDLFFTAEYKNTKGKEDIYVSRLVNGKYTTPTSLPNEVNSKKYEFNAFVAPDESYIIFTSYGRKDGYGGGDLYISRKDKNNKWLPAKNLGKKINSKKLEYCPFVDTTTNTLYFTSDKNNIEAVNLSSTNFKVLLQKIKKSPNGLSRIYYSTLNK